LNEKVINIETENEPLRDSTWLVEGGVTLRAGKKRYKKILVI